MNFTREPIIETIITPKEGYKLVVRNSKGGAQEEYLVDSVEVVSFGHSFFFRSLERPKCFLVPVSDYEVVETKETRVALKNVSHERSIKIGGGRDAPIRTPREPVQERTPEPAVADDSIMAEEEAGAPSGGPQQEQRKDQKRDRHRRRRRRSGDDRDWQQQRGRPQEDQQPKEATEASSQGRADEGGGAHDETPQVSSSMFSTLFPPPPTLISETISRYKDTSVSEGNILPKPVEPTSEDHPPEKKRRKHDEESTGGDTQNMSRTTISSSEAPSFYTHPTHGTIPDDNQFKS